MATERIFPPTPRSRAERAVEALRFQHHAIAADLGQDDEKAPAWFAHLPNGETFPIRLIGTRGPFIRFIGFGASDTACDYVLLSPEQVVVSIRTLDRFEERRPPVGFVPPDEAVESEAA